MGVLKLDKANILVARIPLVDLAMTTTLIGGAAFSAWHNRQELKKTELQMEVNLTNVPEKKEGYEIQQWTVMNKHDDLAKRKLWIAMDIMNIAASALGLIGLYTSLPVLAITGKCMILINLAVSAFWLYKCYNEENYREAISTEIEKLA